jgi:lipoprotein-anchoring transpeptidase ErfK/SrfK
VRRSQQILVAIAAAAVIAAAIAAAALIGRGDGSGPRPRAAPATVSRQSPKVKERRVEPPKAKPHRSKPVARPKRAHPRAARPVALPRLGRSLPWHRTGVSKVARALNRHLAIYARPGAKRPAALLRNPDRLGIPRVLLIHSQRRKWIRLYMPTRPDGRTGWVRRRAVRVLRDPYRIVIQLRRHQLTLWRHGRRVYRTRIVAGAGPTPTPRGLYYVTQLLKPPDPNGAYGPYSFGLSAHSRVLKRFAGGNGQVGIHGTNQPWLLGKSVSHGCIRVHNAAIRRLARILPLGTPVWIRS